LPRTPSRRTRPAPQPPQPTTRGDHEIVEGIRRASEEEFHLLYERYFQRLYSFAYLRLRNHADAEEVVQETFTVVFRSIEAYRGQSSLLSWIYGIAKNTVNNHVRRARAYEARIERAGGELQRSLRSLASCTPEENLTLRRCAEALRARLASVADWHAEVFLLRHVENLPIDEIARRMSRSNDAVRSSLYRVKRLLVEAIDPTLVRVS
jgi:RNA polymerase sigma-70 factor (ECF subfamily)